MKALYSITEWITRFAYVNILWGLFSFAGLILFGFFPATIAMFAVVRKWMIGEDDIPVFKTFWESYKKEFFKSNLLGIVLAIIGIIIYADLLFLSTQADNLLIQIPFYLFIILTMCTVLYVIPVFVHYDVSFYQIFKNAFLIMLLNPLSTLLIVLGIAVSYLTLTVIPGVLFFFGGSVMTYAIMWPCYRAFTKIEQKKKANNETETEHVS